MHDASFPSDAVEPPGEDTLTRRRFTQAGVALVGVCYASAIGYPIYRYLGTPARRASELGAVNEVSIPLADLPPAGSAMMFRFGVKPAMLIHHADGSKACFSAVCTHLGCTVQFQPEEGRIYCACHGGVYDMHTGANVAGPPPKPLTAFNVETQDEQIVITRA
jgi:cytochrome b6-f complex iron-sulfur subunit